MSGTPTTTAFNSGSHWHRWDPHIHAPGTILNDLFGRDLDKFDGGDVWDKYLRLLVS
jgi:hypothetical protein